MQFKKGQSGNPAGRPKGAQYLNNRAVLKVMEEEQCDPIRKMAKIATDEKTDTTLRFEICKELAQHIHSKRKAVEVSGDEDGPVTHVLKWHDWSCLDY